MLADLSIDYLMLQPKAQEVRPYTGDVPLIYGAWPSSISAFPRCTVSEAWSVVDGTGEKIFLSLPNNDISSDHAAHDIVHGQEVRQSIDRVCTELRFSKSALSDVLGVSRQTIYDWISSKNESFRADNLTKIDWLSELASSLNEAAKAKLWLWRDRNISDGVSIYSALKNAQGSPQHVARQINELVGQRNDRQRVASIDNEKVARGLLEKSAPFANND